MADLIPPYPLLWPEGIPRTKEPGDAQFRTTRAAAMDNVESSLAALAKDSGIRVTAIAITSNVAGLRETQPKDPGVSVWFEWDGDMRCIAVDRYRKVEWNLQAIHHLIEADRTKIRHGGLAMVRAAYRGMSMIMALRGPEKGWREVLGLGSGPVTPADVQAYYKARARELAQRGDHLQLQELNVARDQALKEVGNG